MKIIRRKISGNETGTLLLDFLVSESGLSRRKAKELLDHRIVFVNGQRVWMARHKLARGDEVEVRTAAEPVRPGPIRILYRDAHLMVANKPPGILSNGPDSLEDVLRRQLDIPTLLAVHRLDRDTSGCLILAKDGTVMERMLALFREHAISKTYHVLVGGRVTPQAQEIREPVDGLPAVTQVRVLDANATASHLLARIDTGRTHQIRRHMEHIRHPVLGDRAYGTGSSLPDSFRAIDRQMLHAYGLVFTHPFTGQKVHFTAPCPRISERR